MEISLKGELGGKSKTFKENYGTKLEFPGGGSANQIPFHGGDGVWICFGTTHIHYNNNYYC